MLNEDTGTQHYLADSCKDYSRNAVKADLVGKIIYDDPTVFSRLRTRQVDNDLVDACAASFHAANEGDIILLKNIVAKASKKTVEDLEQEEKRDKEGDPNKDEKSGNHGSADEKAMYAPLLRLFNYVTNFDDTTARRTFQKTNGMFKAEEPHTLGFPSYSPDFTISPDVKLASRSKKWRHRDAFGEVKPSNKQSPKPAKKDMIAPIVTQSADYARLFMSARPFMLFCVGILIFGTEFSVGIFDRDGITFSPAYDIFEHHEQFIRVVRSIACNLTIQQLGLDPTVRVLTDAETQTLTGTHAYPSAVLTSGGDDPRQWCTVGPPIWSSMSLLGRGTHVWRVRQFVQKDDQQPSLKGNEMILKTAWRSSARMPESDIYTSISHPPEGLAKFECGGDVMVDGYPITVRNLRSQSADNSLEPATPVLHRLVLGTVGRPMWEYTSDLELLTGFRDALQAHKDLCGQGILHRDISAGNILLTATEDGPLRGFITDLEFARIESLTITQPEKIFTSTVGPQNKYNDQGHLVYITPPTTCTHIRFESTETVKRGASMTGTAQFMARQLLQGVIADGVPVTHEAKHDVESFIWVFTYCVMRNLYHRASKRASRRDAPQNASQQFKEFRHIFFDDFSQATPKAIAKCRQVESAALEFSKDPDIQPIVTEFMSKPLIAFFTLLQKLLWSSRDVFVAIPLTHDALLAAINDTIVSLQ